MSFEDVEDRQQHRKGEREEGEARISNVGGCLLVLSTVARFYVIKRQTAGGAQLTRSSHSIYALPFPSFRG